MEIKTTRDLGVWFTNIRECSNSVIQSNPINLKYLEKKWIALEDLKELIRRNKMDEDELKWNKTHPDWNKAMILIENAITSDSRSSNEDLLNKGYEVNQK